MESAMNMDWKTIMISLLVVSSLLLVLILPSSDPLLEIDQNPSKLRNSSLYLDRHENSSNQRIAPTANNKEEHCDFSAGKWVGEPRGSAYTNWSCPMLPETKNCGKYGKGLEHTLWKWRPDACELPMFDPSAFLRNVRGKKMAFVGDSLARNHMDSLLCLLNQEETPINTYKDFSDKYQTWYFPSHDFTVMAIWAEFLVERTERFTTNGTPTDTFDLHLDRVNPIWAQKLPDLNYIVISGGNWFIRTLYLHENGIPVGCTGCRGENLTELGTAYVIRRVFRTALQFISRCEACDGLVALLRTYTPSHFEHGSWSNGGYCNRTRPLGDDETNSSGHGLEFRKIQLEEMEGAIAGGQNAKIHFEVLDVTKAMMARADGHPGRHSVLMQRSRNSDCLHWCLPGPIDMWNDQLFVTLKKYSLMQMM